MTMLLNKTRPNLLFLLNSSVFKSFLIRLSGMLILDSDLLIYCTSSSLKTSNSSIDSIFVNSSGISPFNVSSNRYDFNRCLSSSENNFHVTWNACKWKNYNNIEQFFFDSICVVVLTQINISIFFSEENEYWYNGFLSKTLLTILSALILKSKSLATVNAPLDKAPWMSNSKLSLCINGISL